MIIGKGAMEPVEPEDYDTALDHIKNDFIFAGITEYFDASILLLSRIIGWHPCTYGRLNAKPNTQRLPDSDLLKLKHINSFESLLYEEILNDLLGHISGGGHEFETALKELSLSTAATAVSGNNEAKLLTRENSKIALFLENH